MLHRPVVREVNLHYQDSRSDKVYNVEISQKSKDEFFVDTSYGRRGSTLKYITKTKQPVELYKAELMADKIIRQKQAKGYQLTSDTTAPVAAPRAKKPITDKTPSGILPQLLNEIDESTALLLCANPEFVAQEKHDGERRMVSNKLEAQGINKKGFYVSLSGDLADGFRYLDNCVVDGEDMGSHIQLFDALEIHGKDISALGFADRYRALNNAHIDNATVKISKAAFSESEKLALFRKVQEQGGEGLVFKKIHEPYTSGRPSSGGANLKFKFRATASVVVIEHNEKRSVKIGVQEDDGSTVVVGNVSIPANKEIPSVGDTAEVRYLYFFGRGGSLFQPVFLNIRNDVDASECTISQLKLKPSAQ